MELYSVKIAWYAPLFAVLKARAKMAEQAVRRAYRAAHLIGQSMRNRLAARTAAITADRTTHDDQPLTILRSVENIG